MQWLHISMCMVFLCIHTIQNGTYQHGIKRRDGITFERNGGRFGDDLHSFAQAYWLSLQYNLTLYVQPFDYSDQLVLHYVLPQYDPTVPSLYEDRRVLGRGKSFTVNNGNSSCFYFSTFYCNSNIDWSNKEFREGLKKYIAPYRPWNYMQLPANKRTVAIHARCGGGYRLDTDFCRRRRPYHFPNMVYYGNSLQLMLDRFPKDNFFVHIFTDERNPQIIIDRIKACINDKDLPRVTFSSRMQGNACNCNVVEDFFDMTQFDILIRPNSNMSKFAERVGNHKIVIVPHKASAGRPWGNVSVIEVRNSTPFGIEREQIGISTSAQKH